MEDQKVYPLYLDLTTKVVPFVILVMFIALGAPMIVGGLTVHGGPPFAFALLWTGIIGIVGYQLFSIPYRIAVNEQTSEVEFVSLLQSKRWRATDIISIKPVRGQVGFLAVTSRVGKVKLLNQFDGFHEFIAWLKAHNPSVDLRGC
jgi:hypothetical protein